MKQFVEVVDVVPHIQIWTIAFAVILLIAAYHIWRFGKLHPEIFQPDTTADDKMRLIMKSELRRRYNNKTILSLSIIFLWSIGIILLLAWSGPTESYLYWYALPFAIMLLICLINYKQK